MTKRILNFIIIAAMVCSGLAAENSNEEIGANGFLHKYSSTRSTDLFTGTKGLIDTLVSNLQLSATNAAQAVKNFTTGIQQEAIAFGLRMTNEATKIKQKFEGALTNVTSKLENAGAGVKECVENKKHDTEIVLNEALYNISTCAESRVSNIVNLVSELINVTTGAATAAQEIKAHAADCGNGPNNVFTVGACLGGVLWQTEVKAAMITAQSGLLIARINLSLASLPATLHVCGAAKFAQAALSTGQLVKDLGRCSVLGVVTSVAS